MPTKGVFMRFNGFSYGGWYQYTTFLFRRLKSPENALKRSFWYSLQMFFQNTFSRDLFKGSFIPIKTHHYNHYDSALNR